MNIELTDEIVLEILKDEKEDVKRQNMDLSYDWTGSKKDLELIQHGFDLRLAALDYAMEAVKERGKKC